jgi:hypothetical protein
VSDQQIVYDALSMPVIDPRMISVAVFGSVAFSAVAVASWIGLRAKKSRRSSEDLSKEMMGRGIITLMAAGAVGFLIYAGVQTAVWRYHYTHRHYVFLDGCVTQFEETVQADHDLGVDDFTLQGRSFKLSDSGWRAGYHLSHHHGSPVQEGVHLRAFAQGSHLLRIELVPIPCGAPALKTGGPSGA